MKGTQMWIKRQEWDAQEKHPLRKGELKSQFLTLRVRRACVRACVCRSTGKVFRDAWRRGCVSRFMDPGCVRGNGCRAAGWNGHMWDQMRGMSTEMCA